MRRRLVLYPLMFLSGFAGLSYEMVWTRMLSTALGHEIVAVLAVVAAFFSGLAIGAWLLDKPIRNSQRPYLWYALLEAVIGIWALLLVVLVPPFNDLVPTLIGEQPDEVRQWLISFLLTLLLLLPATAAMGATLPAMEKIVTSGHQQRRVVGGLYAINTFGAVSGTLAATFLLIPALGYSATLIGLAMINGVCVLVVLSQRQRSERRLLPRHGAALAGELTSYRIGLTLLLTGLLGIGYEVLAIRVLSQVLENTIFTFANLLAVYLFGTALGAALYQRFQPKRSDRTILGGLLLAMTGAGLIGVMVLAQAGSLNQFLLAQLGFGVAPAVVGELLIATLVFLMPTLVMGATFAHLAQASRSGLGLGRALALNTLGSALAPLLFGVVLLPVLGPLNALLMVSVAYLALLPRMALGPLLASGLSLGGAAALALSPLNLRSTTIPEGGELLAYADGVMASVAVVSDASGARHLKVNNHYTMGGTATSFADRRQAHLPLLLHPDPHSALFLGIGTGATFLAAESHPNLTATAVELVPEIWPLVQHFGPSAQVLGQDPRFRLVTADARRFVRASDQQFDVIIADIFHPSRDGAASLYTLEHFRAVRSRLAAEGLFCQWLPVFQLDLETLKIILRTFSDVFPTSHATLAHFSLGQPVLGLIGQIQPASYPEGYLRQRVKDRKLAEELIAMRLTSDYELLGGILGGSSSLRDFAGAAPLNTDNLPLVSFTAPGFVYAAPEPPAMRLLALVDALSSSTDGLIDPAAPASFHQRMAAYWAARDAYLRAGVGVRPSNDLTVMLDQIAQPLLNVVELSADFSPAYLPLLQMAAELHPQHPEVSRSLLAALNEANPLRAEARRLQRQLFSEE